MKLVFPVTVDSLGSKVDGTVKIVLTTQELPNDEAGRLFYFRGKYSKMLLSDDNISNLEEELVAAEKITGTTKKSKSQRMRAVLYRVWEKEESAMDFDSYYDNQMEKIINHLKTKLD